MARPALSATRGLDILDFLAAFPGRDFKLSEIMRATDINVASCHAILSALTERGYLVRNSAQKTFSLGPVPMALGDAAQRSQPMLHRARTVVQELAKELGVPVLLTAVAGAEMVGILAATDPQGRGPGLRVGERRPMIPPLGAPFVAWGSEQAIQLWRERGGHDRDAAFAEEQRQALALIRARGFQISLRSPNSPRLSPEPGDAASGYKERMAGLVSGLVPAPIAETIEPEELYEVNLIAAPVFDREGTCAYNLCLGDFADRISGAEALAYAGRLVTACLAVMQAERG